MLTLKSFKTSPVGVVSPFLYKFITRTISGSKFNVLAIFSIMFSIIAIAFNVALRYIIKVKKIRTRKQ